MPRQHTCHVLCRILWWSLYQNLNRKIASDMDTWMVIHDIISFMFVVTTWLARQISLFLCRKKSNTSHVMMTSTNGSIFRVTGPLCGEFPHKGQWRGAIMFSFICAWINRWVKSLGWWFETPSHPLWRHSNGLGINKLTVYTFKQATKYWTLFCDILHRGY